MGPEREFPWRERVWRDERDEREAGRVPVRERWARLMVVTRPPRQLTPVQEQ